MISCVLLKLYMRICRRIWEIEDGWEATYISHGRWQIPFFLPQFLNEKTEILETIMLQRLVETLTKYILNGFESVLEPRREREYFIKDTRGICKRIVVIQNLIG